MTESTKRIIIVGAFNCMGCGKLKKVDQFGKYLTAPTVCECGARSWRLNDIQSEWITENNEVWGETLEKLKEASG